MFRTMQSRTRRALSRSGMGARIFFGIAIVALTSSCDVHGITGPGSLASIKVTPDATMQASATQQMIAVGYDAEGRVVPITPSWSVVASGGTINGAGSFVAGTVMGVFANTVVAAVGGISGNASITVIAGPLASITVTPNPATLAIGATQQFTAVGRDATGNIVPITPVWSAMAGGTMTSTGLFTAGAVSGTFTNAVQVTSGGVGGTATVIVTPGPLATITVTPNPATLAVTATQQFTAVGRDASGNVVAITPTWSLTAGGGTLTAGGLFTAGAAPGTYTNTVRAASGAIAGTATVIVTTGPLATMTVTPNPATMPVRGTQQFTAVGADAQGNAVAISPVWSVTAGGGSIDGAGFFTAGATPGTFTNTVRATSGGMSATATVIVTAGAVTSIVVTPDPATVPINGTQQFTAVGRDASGNVVAISPIWSAGPGGTITAGGLFTAGTVPGTYLSTVRATSGAAAGSATVIVTSGPATTLTVSPNPANVQTNGTQLFVAVATDAAGNIVPSTPVWAVVAGGGVINATTGVFTAGNVASTFPNTVQATSGGLTGVATVNVTAPVAPALATIVVTPNPASMTAGSTQQFVATGRDGNGNIIPIVPVWSATAGGTINAATGLFTAGALAGTFPNAVRASVGLVSGTATVIVTAAAPPPPIIDLGTAASNGIMAGQAVTCVNLGTIFADVAISPGNTITGFGPCVITGVQHLNDGVAIQNQIDLTAAFNQLAGQPCPAANVLTANLGGTTKTPGVYCSGSTIGVTGTVTLDGQGDPNASFIFKAGTGLTTAGNVLLINGAQAKNVYWLVGSSATIGTASQWQGNIIALTSITLVDNAILTGRALARNGSVSLGTGNIITLP